MNLLINPLLFKFQISSQMSICLTPFPKKNSIYRVGGGGEMGGDLALASSAGGGRGWAGDTRCRKGRAGTTQQRRA
jgi:hypothetical protein